MARSLLARGDRLEAAFRQVGAVLSGAARLVWQRPLPYVLAVLGLLMVRQLWLLSMDRLVDVDSPVEVWCVGLTHTALRLAVYLAVFGCAASQWRGVRSPMGWREVVRRFGRALPYGVGVLLALEMLGGMSGFGLTWLLGRATGAEHSTYTFMFGVLLGAIPALWLVGRLGFPLVGAAAGEEVSLGGSWRMTSGQSLPITVTLFLWWAARHLPIDLLLLFAERALPLWALIHRPYHAVVSIFFAVAGVVWYETLRGRDAQATAAPTGSAWG
jgi:hypothetical protein